MTPRERLVILSLLREPTEPILSAYYPRFSRKSEGNGAGTSHGFPGPAGTGRADDAPPQGLSFLMAKNRRMRAVLAEQLLFISREEELLIRMRDSCPPEGTEFPGAGGRIRFFRHGGNLLETFFETQYRKAFSLPENAVKFGSALFVHMVHGSFHIAAFQAG